jgi:hypothetical protein
MDLIEEIILPKNWQELISIKEIIPFCINTVTRFSEDNQSYEDYKNSISREEHLQNILDEIGDQDLKIVPNKFPYSRLIQHIPDIEHYCLWCKTESPSTETIESEIKKQFPENEYFWFVNPPINKSVPEIWHCQLFVKKI